MYSFDEYAGKAASVSVLGFVCWYSVCHLRVSESNLSSHAAACGLKSYPKLGHPSDAFRRATSESQSRDGDVRLLVRPVADDKVTIERHVILERLDRAGRSLGHTKVASLVFDKAAMTMRTRVVPGAAGSVADETRVIALCDEARQRFDEYRTSLTGPEISRFVMRELDAMSNVTVHPNGGVYFVPVSHRDRLNNVRDFVRGLTPFAATHGDKATFAVLPVPDLDDQRKTIEAGFADTMTAEINAVVADVADLLSRPSKPSDDAASAQLHRLAAAQRKAAEYQSLLNIAAGDIVNSLAMLDTQVQALVDRASKPDDDQFFAAAIADGFDVRTKNRTAEIKYRSRPIATASTSDRGWALRIKPGCKGRIPRDLRLRPEYGESSIKSADPQVLMLFLRAAARR